MPGPLRSGEEQPQKAVRPGDRHGPIDARRRVGHQLSLEQARPLHPALDSGNADPKREGYDNPRRRVAPRLFLPRVMGEIPPGGPPSHSGKNAAFPGSKPRRAAHGPGHAAQRDKEQRRQDQIAHQVRTRSEGRRRVGRCGRRALAGSGARCGVHHQTFWHSAERKLFAKCSDQKPV